MKPAGRREQDDVTLRYSPAQAAFFAVYFGRFFRRHMNALRVVDLERVRELGLGPGPLVVYTNHPGWWDGALYVLLARHCFRSRRPYAPIEADMLRRYSFFGRIGGFGVDLERREGAAAFLRQSASILARPESLLWVSAQGRFSDVRRRPLGLRPGVGRLCEVAPDARIVPAAFDYAFWDERGAEALVRFGEPIAAHELAALGRAERLELLERHLTDTLDRLAEDAISRDPDRFDLALSGRAGIGGLYDGWRHLVASVRGERWDAAHGRRP